VYCLPPCIWSFALPGFYLLCAVFLYATEACVLLARDQNSLEFTTTKVFIKMFRTNSSAVIVECQHNFIFLFVQRQPTIHTAKFLQAFAASDNHLCSLSVSVAVSKLNSILTSFSVKSTSKLVNDLYDLS